MNFKQLPINFGGNFEHSHFEVFKLNFYFQDGLDFIAHWNMSMLQSEDLMKAAVALISKDEEPPEFSKL